MDYSNYISKQEFYNLYFKKSSLNEKSKNTIKNYINKNDSIKELSQNSYELILTLKLSLKASIFNIDFRENLIFYLQNTYENRAFILFFIQKIYYETIRENQIPLVYSNDELYKLKLPIKCIINIFKKDDIASLKLIININDINSVYGENKSLLCKIILNKDLIIDKNFNEKKSVLRNNKTGNIYKNGQQIKVKLTNFYNNNLETGYTKKINCEGIMTF